MKKLLVIQNIIYPHRTALFNEMAKLSGSMCVYFLSDTASNRQWTPIRDKIQHNFKVLSSIRIKLPKNNVHDIIFNPFALIQYFMYRPDVVLSIGWANTTNMLYMLLAIVFKTPYYLLVESTEFEGSRERSIFKPLVNFFVSHSSGCFVPGELQDHYVKSYSTSVPTYKILNCIPTEKFVRSDLTSKRTPNILFVGRFVKIKNIAALIEACGRLRAQGLTFTLTLAGYGPEEKNLKKLVRDLNLKDVTEILYMDIDSIHTVYSKADVFVLPSLQEPWGFVVNEAIASGLPCIVSSHVGASTELVHHNKNGYIFDPLSTSELSNFLVHLLKNQKLRIKFGETSYELSQSLTVEQASKKYIEVLTK